MSKVRLTGTTSGFTELTAPAVAGSNTITLPTGNGTADQRLVTDGSGALSFTSDVMLAAGSAGSPSLYFSGDTNTGIYSPGADQVGISTGGTGRVFVHTNGNLGVGTVTAAAAAGKIHSRADQNTVSSLLVLQNKDGGSAAGGGIDFVNGPVDRADNRFAYIRGLITGASQNGNHLAFGTNPNGGEPTERARIDSSGRLLVGTSTRRANFNNTTDSPFLQLEATSFVGASLSVVRNVNSDSAGGIILGKTRGASLGSNTIVNSGDNLGIISWQGADGTDMIPAAQISCSVDGTPGANDMPGRLVFSTTADGNSSPTERMRINSEGHVLVGTTVPQAIDSGSTDGITLFKEGTINISRNSNNCFNFRRRSSNGVVGTFYRDTTQVGTITVTTTATAYNTFSDYRLKENITLLDGAIARLNQLPVHRFNFIADPDTVVDGFIAHEAAAVVPESVTGEKDEVDDDGNPVMQGIDQSKLVPLLTAALQEAIAKIETLEARITALEVN
jgi:hypothetical protein